MVAPLIGLGLSLASEFAPSVIRFFAGDKAGDVSSKVIDAAKAATGLDTDDESELAAAMRADPQAALAFRQSMAAVEVELEKAFLEDRQDARARDVAMRSAGQQNRRADWMIIGDVVGLVACLALIFFVTDMPGEIRGILSMVASYFGLGLRDAHQFEFGSSRGSKEKDGLLAKTKP